MRVTWQQLAVAVALSAVATLAVPAAATPAGEGGPTIEIAPGVSESAIGARSGAAAEFDGARCGLDDTTDATGCIAIGTWASPPGASYNYTSELGNFSNVGTDPPGLFPTDSDSLEIFAQTDPGTYTFTQVTHGDTFPSGPVACDGQYNSDTLTFSADSITIDLDAEELVTCDFANTAHIIDIAKTDLASVGGAEFPFSGTLGDFSLSAGGTESFDVPRGLYTVSEQLDAVSPGADAGLRWEVDDIECSLEPTQPGGVTFGSSMTENPAAASVLIDLDDFDSHTVECAFTNDLCSQHPFSDVTPWVSAAVDWVYCGTYMDGYPGNTFRPDNNITRAQVANLLHGIAGSPAPGAGCGGLTDVPLWARDAICWLVNEGYASGYPDLTFRPNDPITRAQVSRMLFRSEGSPPGSPANTFDDVLPWVADAVDWLTDPNRTPPYATGYPNNTFRPNNNITRAETTRMVCRINASPGTC